MPVALAETSDAIRETLTDKGKLKELMGDVETFVNWVDGSIRLRMTKDPAALDQVNEQVQKFMVDWLRDNSTKEIQDIQRRLNLDSPNARGRVAPNTLYNAAAIGAAHDRKFGNTGEFLRSISSHAERTQELNRKLGELSNDLSSVKPSDGGYLIPEILRAEILRVALEKAVVRSRARVIPMDSLTVPFPMVDSTSNVSSVFGGVVGYWTEEGATLTESQPSFGRMELTAHKLTMYTEVPSELLRDARPSMEAFINGIFPEAIAWFEDVAFFVGGGVGEPEGFLNADATIDVTRNTASEVRWVDIVSMYARMLPQSLDRAVWVISPEVLPQLLQMTVGGNAAVWLGGGNFPTAAANPPMQMLGLPLIVSEKARQLGAAGDVSLVDFGFYLIGDRQAMSARQSDDFRFDQDKTAFRIIERIDGRPWLQSAITPQNGGDTLSPFVQLAA